MIRDEIRAAKKKKVLGLVMTVVMFGSVFTFIFFGFQSGGRASGVIDYNGFELVNRGSYWSTTIDGREALFTYIPSDLGFIFINNDVISKLRNKIQIDTSSEFNDTFSEPIALAQFQMGVTLNNFNIFLRNGFTFERQNFPVITCDDASDFVPVIYFKSANATKIYLDNNCIRVEAVSRADIVRIKDKLVYGILGII